MATKLLPGAAVALTAADGSPVSRLLIGAHWTATHVEVDLSCLLLNSVSRVPSREHFLFRGHRVSPERTGFVRYLTAGEVSGPDRAQVLLNLAEMPQVISRVTIALAPLRQGGTLDEMGQLGTSATDIGSGQLLYRFSQDRAQLSGNCMTLWALARVGTMWEARITARPYPGGPPALARDHGAR